MMFNAPLKSFFHCVAIAALIISGCRSLRSTGQIPAGAQLDSIKQLANYREEGFINIDKDSADVQINFFKVLKDQYNKPATTRPSAPLPVVKTDLLKTVYDRPTVIWFGHSGFLIKTKTANILVDPQLSNFAGPFSWFMKAFDGTDVYSAEDMPLIDILIISHDHYDHLDYNTMIKLKDKIKLVVVPIGLRGHFIHWGYDPAKINELNWGDQLVISSQVSVTATPSRHTSGRMFSSDRTLWASYVIESDCYKIFYSGDTGYGSHFKQIGDIFGSFDLALMECGQYGRNWPHNHMFPEQTAQAAADLHAKLIQPVHWGKFAEAHHPWNESVKRMVLAADSLGIQVNIPKIGESYTLGDAPFNSGWYLDID